MFRKFHLLFALVLALPAASYGLVGGPFDNGDYSQTLDESGIYQASLRFPNGQGFCQFGSNVDITNFIDLSQNAGGAGGGSTVSRNSVFSYLNRSVIYFKGVTYLGQAWGMVDMSRKTIEGTTNGNSDVSTTTTTSSNNTNNNQSAISAVNQIIGNNNRGMVCNSAWTAKIQPYSHILHFAGDGQLTVLNPDQNTAIGQAVSALLAAYPTAASGATGTAAITAITNAITQVIAFAPGGTNPLPTGIFPNAEATYNASDSVHLSVHGSRKYFLGGTRR